MSINSKCTRLREYGYTMVEVGTVLAVGSMIILTALLAVPAFQRNAQDNQFKDAVADVARAVTAYNADNVGVYLTNETFYSEDKGIIRDTRLGRYLNTNMGQLIKGYVAYTSSDHIGLKNGSWGVVPAIGDIAVYPSKQCGELGAGSDGKEYYTLKPAARDTVAVVTSLYSGNDLWNGSDSNRTYYCVTAK